MAPRRYEGIGMAFLEAMAMEMCVVAENQSTANEYILSGKNVILYGGDRIHFFPHRKVLCPS
jgi:glycosyltransferase involved in cell wall biosynthesis